MSGSRRKTWRWAVAVLISAGALTALAGSGVASVVLALFDSQGPAGIIHVDSGNGPFAGAIKAVVPHPTDPDVVWVGTVNGGVWKTTSATSSPPAWTPLTDHMPSLGIGALDLDPTFPSHDVLVAGIGNWSSFSGVGGPLTGILRTTDGGATWSARGADDLGGEDVSGIAARGDRIVVTSRAGQGGVWHSTDTGAHFARLSGDGSSGLPGGDAYDLAGDPSNPHRLYAAISGSNGGIYRSDDDGATWTSFGGGTFDGAASSDVAAGARNMKVSVHANEAAGTNVVYAAVTDSSQLVGVFRRAEGGAWRSLDLPKTTFNGTDYGLHPGSQVRSHLSLVADPEDPSLLYLGGDRRPQGDGGGRLFRCDAGKPAGTQCTEFTHDDTADDSAPHPDSRDMQFDAGGDLLETDDGGIYRRTNPQGPGGRWSSMNRSLVITETHSCAYDHVSDIILCGTQDNGGPQQRSPGGQVWEELERFDGGLVAVTESDLFAVRYSSTKQLSEFSRALCLVGDVCFTSTPTLNLDGGAPLPTGSASSLPLYTPIASHAVDPFRLIIADTAVYESTNGGDDLTTLAGFTGTATRAIAYGTEGNPEALYVGSSDGLFARRTGGEALSLTNYPGNDKPVSISLDPGNAASAWVVEDDAVRHTADFGGSWENVTGDIADAGAGELYSIAFIPGPSASIIAVGADNGLYVTNTTQLGRWSKVKGTFPNAVVYDLEYDAGDDLLLLATLGRGAWTMPQASQMNLPPIVNVGPDAATDEGSTFTRTRSFSDPDGAAGEVYTATVDYGDGAGPAPLPLSGGSFTLHHVYVDDGSYTVTVVVTDGDGATGADTMTVTVANVPPSIVSVSVAPTPAALGTIVYATATFTDPGVLDTHTATIAWGDGSGPTAAIVSGSNTSGTVSGSHVYAGPGVYTVTVNVTDKDGGAASATYQYAVVYDPEGGFVTGGGWIQSPAGAYAPDPGLTGKASFGFVSKYHKGRTTPDGNTRFQFHAAGFDFASTSYEWLVIAGAKAQYRGAGTVNGAAGYGFWLSAIDGELKGSGFPDTFRIRIWALASGTVIYDNQWGDSDTAAPTTALGGGTITIHP